MSISSRLSNRTNQELNTELICALRGESIFTVAEDSDGGNVSFEEHSTADVSPMRNTHSAFEIDLDFDATSISSIDDMMERAKYIPLRLSYEERKALRLVNAAINVSDYTNSVDIEFKSNSKRRHVQLQNICGFLSGVIAALSYDDGQRVLQDRNFADYQTLLQVTHLSSFH